MFCSSNVNNDFYENVDVIIKVFSAVLKVGLRLCGNNGLK